MLQHTWIRASKAKLRARDLGATKEKIKEDFSVAENVAPIDMLVIGPLARSAGDLAIGLSTISGLDEIESAGLKLSLPPPHRKRLDEYSISILVDDDTVPLTRDVVTLQQELADFLKSSKVKVKIGARPDFDADEAHRPAQPRLPVVGEVRQVLLRGRVG